MKSEKLLTVSCPVCQFGVAAPFFDGGTQPLATLGWSASKEAAQSMQRHSLTYVQCPRCTHVWNHSFSYEAIPYQKNPNRMFNSGAVWQGHLKETRDLVISRCPDSPTVIDVGCGEGHFVRGIAQSMNGKGRFMGFDPSSAEESGRGVEFHARCFHPLKDVPELAPDVIVMRHVIEHLTEPSIFLDQLAVAASCLNKPVLFFAEVPCIDRVMTSQRLGDFFYEHPSQYTTRSFKTLMERGGDIQELSHGYDSEVIYALVVLGIPTSAQETIELASNFHRNVNSIKETIRRQLKEIFESGKSVAIWGGTGKAAAFIHNFDISEDDIPLVVDSDPEKVGTYVPKSGQAIQFRDVLRSCPADVVIIPSQWRAKDIVAEMDREGIKPTVVLIEHEGRLIDFRKDNHPYRR